MTMLNEIKTVATNVKSEKDKIMSKIKERILKDAKGGNETSALFLHDIMDELECSGINFNTTEFIDWTTFVFKTLIEEGFLISVVPSAFHQSKFLISWSNKHGNN